MTAMSAATIYFDGIVELRQRNNLGSGDAMLIAAILFVVGLLTSWYFTMLAMIATTVLIMIGATILIGFGPGLDLLHGLLILGYLTAHQSGYLVGAYWCYHAGRRDGRSPSP